MAGCCQCPTGGQQGRLPLICLVPRGDGAGTAAPPPSAAPPAPAAPSATSAGAPDFPLLDDEYIKKHFKLPPRPLYLDPFRRPLITFPTSQEAATHFNMARKTKINQQILDGYLDPSEAISAPSVFPYSQKTKEADKTKAEEEEVIYILQLPDWEFKCPLHDQVVKTPRFIWHSCKKSEREKKSGEPKAGGGPLHRPKPWLLSRHTDFDMLSQW
ncbi:uncharacterized protein LOC106715888 [Papilio machaon]|uniref:uncharacterized protein LOC106715888 n=1 Tax=Papilio machaon TaxID=76193 RepID=UPI001E663545|nr:uncharacterized protein LOC106715888 [Papilio machaon]